MKKGKWRMMEKRKLKKEKKGKQIIKEKKIHDDEKEREQCKKKGNRQ